MKRFFSNCSLIAFVIAALAFLFWDYLSLIPPSYWLKALAAISATAGCFLILMWALNAIGPRCSSSTKPDAQPKETKKEYLRRRIISHASYEWRPEVVVFFNILDETANDGYPDYCTREEFLKVLNELKAEDLITVQQESWTGELLSWVIRRDDLHATSTEN